MRLKDKVIVITGAASGMGLAMTQRFSREGAKIVAGDWNQERLDAAVEALKAEDVEIIGLAGDISQRQDAEALIDAAIAHFGRIDVLCNNAGIMDYFEGVADVEDELWHKVHGVNLNGPMFATRKALSHMLPQGQGSIINTASTAARHAGAAGVAYTSSKHALLGLTKSTAWMYATQGIRCNAICPGATKTNIQESIQDGKMSPFGLERLGPFQALAPNFLNASDIADLALFLASDESKMINGAIIPADAGWDVV